jgi:hypothetical protein
MADTYKAILCTELVALDTSFPLYLLKIVTAHHVYYKGYRANENGKSLSSTTLRVYHKIKGPGDNYDFCSEFGVSIGDSIFRMRFSFCCFVFLRERILLWPYKTISHNFLLSCKDWPKFYEYRFCVWNENSYDEWEMLRLCHGNRLFLSILQLHRWFVEIKTSIFV